MPLQVNTLHNVCSVHRGDIMSTSGGYHEYIGGCSVHRKDTMSTSRDVQYIRGYHDACGGYHEYTGGCSVHRRDIMSTLVEYHEYLGDVGDIYSVHQGFQQKLKGF